jgi:excisionase family DNA binding protein
MRASPEKIEEILSYPTCNVEEAASVLGVARGTAYRMARDDGPNGLPVIRLGGQHRLRDRQLPPRPATSRDGTGRT